MDEKEMQQEENWPCVLWAKSSVFAKHLLLNPTPTLESLVTDHEVELPPLASQLLCWKLTRTFRFGVNLAHLLDELVYDGIGFTSVAGNASAVDILVISTPRADANRANLAESHAIRTWIQNNGTTKIAVLAPYRNQVAQLRGNLPQQLQDDILTVHGSQGREWDTIILSATDTMANPFFTDSQIPIGKLVMNTALSRAKKSIVLVCDAGYWAQKHDAQRQLLSRLIGIARRI